MQRESGHIEGFPRLRGKLIPVLSGLVCLEATPSVLTARELEFLHQGYGTARLRRGGSDPGCQSSAKSRLRRSAAAYARAGSRVQSPATPAPPRIHPISVGSVAPPPEGRGWTRRRLRLGVSGARRCCCRGCCGRCARGCGVTGLRAHSRHVGHLRPGLASRQGQGQPGDHPAGERPRGGACRGVPCGGRAAAGGMGWEPGPRLTPPCTPSRPARPPSSSWRRTTS